ncbi:MAG: hypothetical protein AB2809_22260 [Candidatus Thiodiazotropha sp.]
MIVEDPDEAKIYAREFRENQEKRIGRQKEGHDPHPEELVVSGVPIKILFGPGHNPEMGIMK